MNKNVIFIPFQTPALTAAEKKLTESGFRFTSDAACSDCILLPVPTPPDVDLSCADHQIVFGGKLDKRFHNGVDLLMDESYLAQNAAITAEAALGILLCNLKSTFSESPVLIIGWGRIGKCLGHLLRSLRFPVFIAAHREKDQSILQSLGYNLYQERHLSDFKCIINTADGSVLQDSDLTAIRPDCFLLDLASKKQLPGSQVEHRRGLPGLYKSEASGLLIAEYVMKYFERMI